MGLAEAITGILSDNPLPSASVLDAFPAADVNAAAIASGIGDLGVDTGIFSDFSLSDGRT